MTSHCSRCLSPSRPPQVTVYQLRVRNDADTGVPVIPKNLQALRHDEMMAWHQRNPDTKSEK